MTTVALLRAKLAGTTFLSGASFRQLRERDQLWVVPLAAVGICVAVGGLVYMLYANYRGIATIGLTLGQPELPLYVATLVTWVFVLLVGFPVVLSVQYLSRDGQLLACLPIPAHRIVAANLWILYGYSVPVALCTFVPGIVAAGSVMPVGVGFITSAILVTATVPFVPLAVAALLVCGVTRLVNLSRYRTVLEALGMALLVAIIVVLQLVLSRSAVNGLLEGDVPAEITTLVLRIQSAIPPARWVALAFIPSRLVMLLVTLATAAGSFLCANWVTQLGYLHQLSEQATTKRRTHRLSAWGLPRPRTPFRALIARELKIIASNSSFLFESVAEVLIFPLLLAIFRFSMPRELMNQILPLITDSRHTLPIATFVLLLMAGVNSVTSAAISREGKLFDLSLSLPVGGRVQVSGKLATYYLMFWPAFAANCVIAISILRAPWWHALGAIAAGTPFLLLVGAVTIYTDVRRPLLNWNHPQQAVKQNMNVVIGMGLAIVAIAGGALPALGAGLLGASVGIVMVVGGGVASAACVVALRLVLSYAEKRYAQAFAS
jgi:ABC-2 type transport system permease protein